MADYPLNAKNIPHGQKCKEEDRLVANSVTSDNHLRDKSKEKN